MSYIIVSEYLCDCIGHVNRVSESEEEVERGKEGQRGKGRGRSRDKSWEMCTCWSTRNQEGMNSYLFFILEFVTVRLS